MGHLVASSESPLPDTRAGQVSSNNPISERIFSCLPAYRFSSENRMQFFFFGVFTSLLSVLDP